MGCQKITYINIKRVRRINQLHMIIYAYRNNYRQEEQNNISNTRTQCLLEDITSEATLKPTSLEKKLK